MYSNMNSRYRLLLKFKEARTDIKGSGVDKTEWKREN